jgi:hypothetical protein
MDNVFNFINFFALQLRNMHKTRDTHPEINHSTAQHGFHNGSRKFVFALNIVNAIGGIRNFSFHNATLRA